MRLPYPVLVVAVALTSALSALADPPGPPTHLRCEYETNPIGVEAPAPRLSWALSDARRGAVQTAYQILVAKSLRDLARDRGDVWDSGRVDSSQSVLLPYGGRPLASCSRYYWKVRTWDAEGVASAFSAPAYWETGPLDEEDWGARWIAAPAADPPSLADAAWVWHPEVNGDDAIVYLRGTLLLPESARVLAASLRVAVDNHQVVYLNGSRLGEDGDWKSVDAYDVADSLRPGLNVVAIEARNDGGACGAIAALDVELADGSSARFVTDETWRASAEAAEGWTAADFADAAWPSAKVVASFGDRPWGALGAAPAAASVRLRRDFRVRGEVASATAYATGLGLYELNLNGRKVGDQTLTPGWTYYPKRVQYQAYDVTDLLRAGANAVGATLANGWWGAGMAGPWRDGPARFLMRLEIRYANGRSEAVVTDGEWTTHTSPVLEDSLYHGETYDARLETPGWDAPGFDASGWAPVKALDLPLDAVVAQVGPPIRVTEELAPEEITQPAEGMYVVDFGQNMPGRVRIRVSGPEGTVVRLRFAEVLKPDGTIYTDNYRSARVTDTYVLRGDGVEEWEPSFTYRGFRYMEVTGWPGELHPQDLTARVLHSDAPLSGAFACSDDLLNSIQRNIVWGQRSNMHSVPTDCPQRDERLGWMGDALIFAPTSCWNMDMAGFYAKWMRDIRDSQSEEGWVTDVAPCLGWGPAAPGWGDAALVVPWEVYLRYGDARIIEENYDAMRAWVEYMRANAPGNLYEREGYGDWVAPVGSPKKPIGAAYYYHSTDLLSRMAAVIGRTEDAAAYAALAKDIRSAFNAAYLDEEAATYPGGTQTANLLPLYFGLAPEEMRDRVLATVVKDIVDRGDHLSTGFLGTAYLMPVLASMGEQETAMRLATQRTYPSWGYMVDKGATTIWELWNSDTEGPGMNSRNHFAFGSVGRWFFEDVAGLQPDPAEPGFAHVIVRPRPAGDLTWAEGSLETAYGVVRARWERDGARIALDVTVPANARATVYVPARSAAEVREGDVPASEAECVREIGEEDGAIAYNIGAGTYHFTSAM